MPPSILPLPPPNRFEVDHVCNLTDVDDKIIKRMARDGVSLQDLTEKYTALFFDDLETLNILPASRYPRATEHIGDIVDMIKVCLYMICCVQSIVCLYFLGVFCKQHWSWK